jgi:hypothetical protein
VLCATCHLHAPLPLLAYRHTCKLRSSVAAARASEEERARVLKSSHAPELVRADAYLERDTPPSGDDNAAAAAAEMRAEHADYAAARQPAWLVEVRLRLVVHHGLLAICASFSPAAHSSAGAQAGGQAAQGADRPARLNDLIH